MMGLSSVSEEMYSSSVLLSFRKSTGSTLAKTNCFMTSVKEDRQDTSFIPEQGSCSYSIRKIAR
jgi:hypothetical protein